MQGHTATGFAFYLQLGIVDAQQRNQLLLKIWIARGRSILPEIRSLCSVISDYFICMLPPITRSRPNLNSMTARHVLQQRTSR